MPDDAGNFRFRKEHTLGAADARDDKNFLSICFVDNGDLKTLQDCDDARILVMGRTGAGKSALLDRLSEKEERVVQIQPEALALSYITNSTILRYVADQLEVKLYPFYKLLWRHVLTVEILRAHFGLHSQSAQHTFFEKLRARLNRRKRQTLDYLERWGETFWEETDYRIKETTRKLESNLQVSLGSKLNIIEPKIEGGKKLTEEEKQEVIHRAQHIVNEVQIHELSQIIPLLNEELLNDKQKHYYIVIDRLDEDWIEDTFRYQLIRSLIEVARDFHEVKQVKVVIALRVDLVDRVFRLTKDTGFQREKYEALYYNVEWNRARLIDLVDSRVNHLVKPPNLQEKLTHRAILTKKVGDKQAIDYIIERTMMRPRDIIDFFNRCIPHAVGQPKITSEMIKLAEFDYSRSRLASLVDEWSVEYPHLAECYEILKERKSNFPAQQITAKQCSDLCLEIAVKDNAGQDEVSALAKEVAQGNVPPERFRSMLLSAFYRVGLVGLKLENFGIESWSTSGSRMVTPSEITDRAHVSIHPCAWRTLGITNRL